MKPFLLSLPLLCLATGSGPGPLPTRLSCVWNPSSDPNVIGYAVYLGVAAHAYYNVWTTTQNQIVVPVAGNRVYYGLVTAINEFGLESDYSNEAEAFVPQPQFPRPRSLARPSVQ